MRAGLLPLLCGAVAAEAVAKPHIILACLDDLGWTDVSYHGSEFKTPVIDGLAMGGVRLEKYYVQPVCSPTRSALMTARYPFRTGLQNLDTVAPASHARLPLDRPTIAEALRDVGYKTHMIGKWHLGMSSWDWTPLGRGFSSYVGYMQGETDYYTKQFLLPGGFDFWRNKTAAYDAVGRYSMIDYQAEAKRVLDNHDPADPLFLYYAHQCIHQPLQEPEDPKYMAQCAGADGINRQTLCAMMTRLDDALGELVGWVKAKQMWADTLMWVTTDNGGMVSFAPTSPACTTLECKKTPASASSNYPLRGSKGTLFEGGVRGIGFVAGGFVPQSAAGSVVAGLLHHVDIPATLAALVGAEWKGDVDGLDVWDSVAKGAPSPRSEVPVNVYVAGNEVEYSGLIQGEWKLLVNEVGAMAGAIGKIDGYWSQGQPNYTHTDPTDAQVAVAAGGAQVHLFNLTADPNEAANVAAAHPDVVARMQQRLSELADPANGYLAPQNNIPYPQGAYLLHNGTWAPFL